MRRVMNEKWNAAPSQDGAVNHLSLEKSMRREISKILPVKKESGERAKAKNLKSLPKYTYGSLKKIRRSRSPSRRMKGNHVDRKEIARGEIYSYWGKKNL